MGIGQWIISLGHRKARPAIRPLLPQLRKNLCRLFCYYGKWQPSTSYLTFLLHARNACLLRQGTWLRWVFQFPNGDTRQAQTGWGLLPASYLTSAMGKTEEGGRATCKETAYANGRGRKTYSQTQAQTHRYSPARRQVQHDNNDNDNDDDI